MTLPTTFDSLFADPAPPPGSRGIEFPQVTAPAIAEDSVPIPGGAQVSLDLLLPPASGIELDASFPVAAEDPFAGPLTWADHFTAWLDRIADALVDPGYLVLDGLLPPTLVDGLCQALSCDSESRLRPAGIGRGDDYQLNRQVRRDKIRWLDTEPAGSRHPAVTEFICWMDKLREGLNQRLFLGLFEYECHFAVYESGDFYQKHRDAFKGNPGRKLSTVFYLNRDWAPADGGELVLYDDSGEQELDRIAPKSGRLVIFLAENFPHEVLAARKRRASIAGWFRVNVSS